MEKTIDCLLIGHNEMDFAKYEESVREMGPKSGAYRDLNLNFIRYNNRAYPLSEIFNIFYYQLRDKENSRLNQFFHVAESLSAAIAYLGTYLHRRGYTFDYVNAFRHSQNQLAEKLAKENILTVAIVTTLYVSVNPIIEIIDFVRSHNRTAKIIIGGPYISTRVRVLAPGELDFLFGTTIDADFFVNSSQGETALVNIIEALKTNSPLDRVHNIYYKTGNGIKSTPVMKEDNKLAENMVDWSLFTRDAYEFINVRTAISCPFSCAFCGFPEHSGKYQTAGVREVELELKELKKIKTLKSAHFIDDTFNVPVQRFKDLLRMIIKNNFDFKWHSNFRCQFADREMVELMKESGCEGVFLGIESGSNQILKNMNKVANIRDYLAGIELLKKYGIVTYGNFIIGFPGETDQTVQDTVDFIEKSQLDFFRAQLWYCEPITPIWKERDRYRLRGESFQWSHATMDSKRACDLVDSIFLQVKKSTWVPQYHFEFDGLWHLVHRGMSIQQARNLLESFNNAVKEKLQDHSRSEAGYEALEQIKTACTPAGSTDAYNPFNKNQKPRGDIDGADFEFLQ